MVCQACFRATFTRARCPTCVMDLCDRCITNPCEDAHAPAELLAQRVGMALLPGLREE